MYIPMPILIGIGIAAAFLFLLALRGGKAGRRRDELMGVTSDRFLRNAPSAMALAAVTPEIEAEARALVKAKRKIEAIKLVREATGMGLKDAKDYVEGL